MQLAGGLNTYAYVEGNPLNTADPLGLRGGAMRPPIPRRSVPRSRGRAGINQDARELFENTGSVLDNIIEWMRDSEKIPMRVCVDLLCPSDRNDNSDTMCPSPSTQPTNQPGMRSTENSGCVCLRYETRWVLPAL